MSEARQTLDGAHPGASEDKSAGSGADQLAVFRHYYRAGQFARAVGAAHAVVHQNPDSARAWIDLSSALEHDGDFAAMLKTAQKALSLEPTERDARAALARALFANRHPDFWRALDVRFAFMDEGPRVKGGDGRPMRRWLGGPDPKHLLLLDEQGLGDGIQFMRFLPQVVARGIAVTFVASKRFHPLVRRLDLPITLVVRDGPGQVKGADAWASLMDLPLSLGLPYDRLGLDTPLIRPDATRVERWRDWLDGNAHGSGPRIGVVWRGNAEASFNAERSASPADFSALSHLPGATLVALQHDATQDECGDPALAGPLLMPPALDADEPFADTLALCTLLDAVVSIDSSVAHLAGSAGVPVHLMLRAINPDWRWGGEKQTSLWYPRHQLWRQDRPGNWSALVATIAEAIMTRKTAAVVSVPVSIGELLDKRTILAIKHERFTDPAKRDNVAREIEALDAVITTLDLSADVEAHVDDLRAVNEKLWEIEETIRHLEAQADFGPDFIETARAVYINNDERARLKKVINDMTGSVLSEEKSY